MHLTPHHHYNARPRFNSGGTLPTPHHHPRCPTSQPTPNAPHHHHHQHPHFDMGGVHPAPNQHQHDFPPPLTSSSPILTWGTSVPPHHVPHTHHPPLTPHNHDYLPPLCQYVSSPHLRPRFDTGGMCLIAHHSGQGVWGEKVSKNKIYQQQWADMPRHNDNDHLCPHFDMGTPFFSSLTLIVSLAPLCHHLRPCFDTGTPFLPSLSLHPLPHLTLPSPAPPFQHEDAPSCLT